MQKTLIAAGTIVATDTAVKLVTQTAGSTAGLMFIATGVVRNAALAVLAVAALKSVAHHMSQTTAPAA